MSQNIFCKLKKGWRFLFLLIYLWNVVSDVTYFGTDYIYFSIVQDYKI